jgi:hypothetical protein
MPLTMVTFLISLAAMRFSPPARALREAFRINLCTVDQYTFHLQLSGKIVPTVG